MSVSSFLLRNSPENSACFMPRPNSFLGVFFLSLASCQIETQLQSSSLQRSHEDTLVGHGCLMVSDHHYNRFSQNVTHVEMLESKVNFYVVCGVFVKFSIYLIWNRKYNTDTPNPCSQR